MCTCSSRSPVDCCLIHRRTKVFSAFEPGASERSAQKYARSVTGVLAGPRVRPASQAKAVPAANINPDTTASLEVKEKNKMDFYRVAVRGIAIDVPSTHLGGEQHRAAHTSVKQRDHFDGHGETFVLDVFDRVLHNRSSSSSNASTSSSLMPPCRDEHGRRQLVLDIGANEGLFGLVAAAWGCEVVLYEPQPACVSLLHAAIQRNGFGDRVSVVPAAVAPLPPRTLPLPPGSKCDGGWANGLVHSSLAPRPRALSGSAAATLKSGGAGTTVSSVSVSDAFLRGADALRHVRGSSRIALAKVDVEGAELGVLTDLIPLLRTGALEHVVFELTPGWWVDRPHGVNDAHAWQLVRDEPRFVALAEMAEELGLVARSEIDGSPRSLRSILNRTISGHTLDHPRRQANAWLARSRREERRMR